MSFKTFAALAGAAAILCGCATVPATPPSAATVAPYADTLSLSGRLNVRYLKDGKQESATVNYTWKQDAQRTDVALSTQFGNIVAMIEVTPQGAVLREGGNKPPLSAPSTGLPASSTMVPTLCDRAPPGLVWSNLSM